MSEKHSPDVGVGAVSSASRTGSFVSPERIDSIDLLRVVAACGIIWFHMDDVPYLKVGFAGLFFLVVRVIFQRAAAKRGDFRDYFSKRALRLLVPWAAWFVIYGLLNGLKGRSVLPGLSSFLDQLLAGPWIGLWFLPFSFIISGLVYGVVRLVIQLSCTLQFVVWLLASPASLALVSLIRTGEPWSVPWAQWLQAAPSIPIGFALACALKHPPLRVRMAVVLNVSICLACAIIYSFDPGMAISYGLGSLAATLFFSLGGRSLDGLVRSAPAALASIWCMEP